MHLNEDKTIRVQLPHDYGRHRQTGELDAFCRRTASR